MSPTILIATAATIMYWNRLQKDLALMEYVPTNCQSGQLIVERMARNMAAYEKYMNVLADKYAAALELAPRTK